MAALRVIVQQKNDCVMIAWMYEKQHFLAARFNPSTGVAILYPTGILTYTFKYNFMLFKVQMYVH